MASAFLASVVARASLLIIAGDGDRVSGALKPSFGNSTLLKARSSALPTPAFAAEGRVDAPASSPARPAPAAARRWRREVCGAGFGVLQVQMGLRETGVGRADGSGDVVRKAIGAMGGIFTGRGGGVRMVVSRGSIVLGKGMVAVGFGTQCSGAI